MSRNHCFYKLSKMADWSKRKEEKALCVTRHRVLLVFTLISSRNHHILKCKWAIKDSRLFFTRNMKFLVRKFEFRAPNGSSNRECGLIGPQTPLCFIQLLEPSILLTWGPQYCDMLERWLRGVVPWCMKPKIAHDSWRKASYVPAFSPDISRLPPWIELLSRVVIT